MLRFFLLLIVLASAHAAERVKLATVLPTGTSYHQILQTMGQEWRQQGVELTIFTGAQMGDESDIVSRMGVGQFQAGVLSVLGLSKIDASVTALQYMPMMFRSLDEVDFVRTKLQPQLEASLLKKGYVVLFWGDAGWIRFFSTQPALKPEDFKSMKMFAWSGDTRQIDLMKTLGYNPRPLATTEIFTSLQSKMIEAVSLSPSYALSIQVDRSAKHMLEVNWVPLVGATVITAKAWNALPEPTRAALRKSALAAGEKMKASGRKEADQSVAAMVKRGLQVHPVTPEIDAAWRKMAEQIYPKISGNIVPKDMFEQVQALLKEYRARK